MLLFFLLTYKDEKITSIPIASYLICWVRPGGTPGS